MNNRFKPRGWHEKQQKMYPVLGINYDYKEVFTERSENKPKINSCGCCDDREDTWFKIEELILMYPIGLKDKNGILIYEKDIVKKDIGSYTIDLHTGKKEHCKEGIFTIKYNQLHCCFGLFKDGSYVEGIVADQHDSEGKTNKEWVCESIEVIGNIYGNPELLTKAKE